MTTRVTDELGDSDAMFETSLRPVAFEEFDGQEKVRERLEIAVTAATQRKEPIDHLLLSGPPG
ncbi:Holliday junction branch migration DNA helicase RuvB, partial [Verrucomicrobia bacterium]|nr:Holliday junction branch migration DNA helicase RuvB [Verrucomicrobiota bacterium]